MKNSINNLWGSNLRELGYSKITVNHFEKKYRNYTLCVDAEIANHLLIRILRKNIFDISKCIYSKTFSNRTSITLAEISNIIASLEKELLSITAEA